MVAQLSTVCDRDMSDVLSLLKCQVSKLFLFFSYNWDGQTDRRTDGVTQCKTTSQWKASYHN